MAHHTERPSAPWALLAGLCVLLPLAAPAHAPTHALTQLNHRVWQTEEGLPQNSVLALARPPGGYLWFGTWEGLVRFDGVRFTVYDRHNTPALRARSVRALAAAPDGTLWVGTDAGVVRLSGGTFTDVTPPEGSASLRRVRALLVDGEALWVGTHAHGLWRLQGGVWRRWEVAGHGGESGVYSLAPDGAGGVWLGTPRGLWRLPAGAERPVHIPLPHSPGEVGAVALSRDGGAWAGTSRGHLVRIHPEGRVEPLSVPELAGQGIHVLHEDAEGSLWVGALSGGLVRLAEGRASRLTSAQGLVTDSVQAMLEDEEGNLWVGTGGGGLHRFKDGVAVPLGLEEGMPVAMASALHQARDGSLWFGTYGGGVVRLQDGRLTPFGPGEGLHSAHIRSIGESRDGSLWFSGLSGGLTRLHEGVFTRWGPEQGVTWEHGRSFAEDETGTLFLATDRGLMRRVGERFELQPLGALPPDGMALVTPGRAGGLWVATSSGRLVRARGGHFQEVLPASERLPALVMAMHEDVRGALWVGTGAGFFRVEGGRLFRFGLQEGLPDEVAFSVLEDAEGFLWMSSNRGVYRLARAELEAVAEGRLSRVSPQVFGTDDGMRSAECNGGVFPGGLLARDGQVWFPTIRGPVAFKPGGRESTTPPFAPVRVEQVVVNGGVQAPAQALTVGPDTDRLEVHYTTPYLRAPERVEFRYRLEGVEREWVEAGAGRVAHYTHLPPGDFLFRVMARRRGEPWQEAGEARVRLQRTPRLTEKPLFWAGAVLGALGLAAAVASWRMGRHRQRARALEARVQERTAELAATNARLDAQYQALQEAKARLVHAEKMAAVGTLAAGVGHEINNPLAYILNNVHFARTALPSLLPPVCPSPEERARAHEVEQALEDALEGVERVRRIVKDLRTFSRAEPEQRAPVRLEEVLALSLNMASSTLRHRARVVRRFHPVPPVLGDSTRLGQLFLNLLVNAAHALPEGQADRHEVRVGLQAEGEAVVVSVEDTGCGIPAEVLPRIFEPFFTTKPVGEGTGLGLSICHAIVQSHGGDIQVESRPGEGTCFRVVLPAAVGTLRAAG